MSERAPIVINREALDRIKEHSLAAPPELETGGILIGTVVDGKIIIFFATGPGEQALHRKYAFEADTKRQQKILDKYFAEYGCNYLGEWHKHPEGLSTLSGGDIQHASAILKDDSYHVKELILPIVNVVKREPRVYVYRFAGKEPFSEEWSIVEPHSDIIKAIRSRAEGASKKKKLSVSQALWYQTHMGKERLVNEKARLEGRGLGYEIFTYPSDDGDLLGFRILLNPLNKDLPPATNVIFITPKDYPSSPPSVALELHGELEEIKIDLSQWKETISLSDLIGEFIDFIFEKVLSEAGGGHK